MLMRGGSSKGVYMLADDLPGDVSERDDLLLRLMGSPDERQIDGLGGAHPLTSKVAVVGPSSRDDADVDYLFLQVFVDEPLVSDRQNCGNLLAGVGPFAIERALVPAGEDTTAVRIHMVNTGELSISTVSTPGRQVEYAGDTVIAGVPGAAAPVVIDFPSREGMLFPTGCVANSFDGVDATCVDDGMPVVVLRAADLGVTGNESCEELESNVSLRDRLERIRLGAGRAMGLGDVSKATVPKLSLVSAPMHGGSISTRTFIPRRCHTSIGVLAGASVAAACVVPGTVAHDLAELAGASHSIEHPTGRLDVEVEVEVVDGDWVATRTAVIRTTRKLLDGTAFAGPTRT